MTASTRTTIKAFFETGDKPTQSNFSDFIDSCAFLAETSAQVFSGSIGVSATISANKGEFTTVSAGTATFNNFSISILSATAVNTSTVSATSISTNTIGATTGNITTLNSTTVNVTTVSATTVNAANVNAAVSASNLSSSGTTNLKGTTTNNDAAAGYIGEYISATIATGSAVSLTSPNGANVTSISLTAGDWDVWGCIGFNQGSGTTAVAFNSSISSTSATLPSSTTGAIFTIVGGGSSATTVSFPTGMTRISIASTTTIYLVALASFSGGTMSAFGGIFARRVR